MTLTQGEIIYFVVLAFLFGLGVGIVFGVESHRPHCLCSSCKSWRSRKRAQAAKHQEPTE